MTETTAADADPDSLAGVVRDAPFLRLVARDDGDALAAAALLARAVRALDTPFQVRVVTDPAPGPDGVRGPDDDLTILVGASPPDGSDAPAIGSGRRPATATAFALVRELGVDPDPVLALAGVVAADAVPGADGSGDALETAERRDLVDRRPGVALPTVDPAAGLSASTLLRAPYSGDPEAVRATLADLGLDVDPDADDHRRLASLVAVDVAAMADASERSAASVERALRPYATEGPFATVGGYADVLEALAREAPGTGVALAVAEEPAGELYDAALEAWRSHGHAAHRALDEATTGRYDGAVVVRVDAPETVLPTVARLVRDFRSPEPLAIVVAETNGALAAAAAEPIGVGDALRTVAAEFDGEGRGTPTRGVARFDGDGAELVAALKEAL